MVSTLQLFALALTMAPWLASAAIYPPNSLVKMLDAKGFKKAMKANQTSMVAFVAPWCGHCQRMVPEYSKAAQELHPLIPVYAVDCDNEANKRLCADQGVQGFPTVKLFPRGNQLGSMTYDSGERTAKAFFNWASLRVPATVTKLAKAGDVNPWAEKTKKKNRALLLTKDKKIPLLWKVLGNKYKGQLELAIHRDADGSIHEILGVEKSAKVLIYPEGSTKPVKYDGATKLDALSKFFDSVLDGTANLKVAVDYVKETTTLPSKSKKEQATDTLRVQEDNKQAEHEKEQVVMTQATEKTATPSPSVTPSHRPQDEL